MLTFTEKRLVEKFLKESQSVEISKWQDSAYSILLAIGGVVVVFVCLATLNNLSSESIKLILLPGVATGMAILLAGAYGLYVSKKGRDQKELACVLEKLMV
jgi:hypothetical protein